MIRPKVLQTILQFRTGSSYIFHSDCVKSVSYSNPSRRTTEIYLLHMMYSFKLSFKQRRIKYVIRASSFSRSSDRTCGTVSRISSCCTNARNFEQF